MLYVKSIRSDQSQLFPFNCSGFLKVGKGHQLASTKESYSMAK